MAQGLFRREALAYQGERLGGDVILSQPLSFGLLAVFLVFITAAALLFLAFNGYSRKQVVNGYLEPDRGMVEVAPPQAGQLLRLAVAPGDRVERGELLFELQIDRRVGERRAVSEERLAELAQREAALRRQRGQEARHLEIDLRHFGRRREALEAEVRQLRRLHEDAAQLLALRATALGRAQTLAASGHLPPSGRDRAREAWLEQRAVVERLALQILQGDTALRELQQARDRAEAAVARSLSGLALQLSELQGQRAALRAESLNRVFAPVAGTVGNTSGKAGQLVDAARPVVSLIPHGSRLQARLLVPSRAAAFLRPGQAVKLRLEAFPYQKFGVQAAVLRELPASPVSSGAAPPGLTSPAWASPGQGAPVFLATAELAAQTVLAYGEAVVLKPGMTLSADVVVEERSLLAWLLDPLLAVRGRL